MTDTTVKAGCYLRMSSDPQDKRAGATRQREDATALCDRADGLMDGQGYRVAIDCVEEQLAALDKRTNDAERERVFDGLVLGQGTEAAAESIAGVTDDRFRAIVAVLGAVKILPVGKGYRTVDGERFDQDRLVTDWQ